MNSMTPRGQTRSSPPTPSSPRGRIQDAWAQGKISSDTFACIDCLEIWAWGDLGQSVFESWRQHDFEPATARCMIEDLLVHASLALDWHAVEVCTSAVEIVGRRGHDLAMATWQLERLSPPLAPREVVVLRTCISAWDQRALRLRVAQGTT